MGEFQIIFEEYGADYPALYKTVRTGFRQAEAFWKEQKGVKPV